MRGRFCFLGGPRFKELASFVAKGAEIKATPLTEVFTLEDFRQTYGDRALILFKENEGGGLSPLHWNEEKIEGAVVLHSLVLPESGAEVMV
jgi:hypothetical protein